MALNCQHFRPLGFGIADAFEHGPFGFYVNVVPPTATTSFFGEASTMHTGNQINQGLGDCLLAGLM